jgi:uncharacterized cupredoxin-like copper-binding protein
VFAAIRPAGQDFPVLLHIVGATIVFGALLASVGLIALARGQVRMFRIGYFALLFVALPGWILMRLSGEWVYRKQGWNDVPDQLQDPTWLRIGFGVADWGGLLFLVALIVGGVAVLRMRSGKSGAGLLKVTMSIAVVLAVGYVGAVWAMTGKPNYATAAAAPSATATGPATAVTVTAREFKFTLSKTSVPQGEVVFTVVNNGKLAHNFWIDGEATPLISPGKSATLTVNLDPGRLDYLCTVPGHAAAGMKGTLTVQ